MMGLFCYGKEEQALVFSQGVIQFKPFHFYIASSRSGSIKGKWMSNYCNERSKQGSSNLNGLCICLPLANSVSVLSIPPAPHPRAPPSLICLLSEAKVKRHVQQPTVTISVQGSYCFSRPHFPQHKHGCDVPELPGFCYAGPSSSSKTSIFPSAYEGTHFQ